MDRLKLDRGPMAIDPYDESLVGDITDRLAPREMAF
jgi:choloylglycine hydrolase